MKKILIILLLSISTYAQHQLSVGIDIRNAIVGSEPTKNESATDWTFQYKARQNHIEIGFSVETFKKINYFDYNLFAGYYTGKTVVFYTNVGFGQIVRNSNIGTFNYEANLGIDYYFLDNFGASYELNFNRRMDLKYLYGVDKPILSNTIKLIYKF
jgi:hypothetical protein